ncbi:MAG: hypothetical protein PHF00_07400 [Elusimicrobia bacterium]|nr:hypothetical protein [Elusimicrobiota bacterium]
MLALFALLVTQRRKLMTAALPAIKQAILGQPDTIILRRVDDPRWKRPELVAGLTQELLAEGFSDSGVFAVDKMPGVLVRLMTGPGRDATAAVCDHPGIGAWVDIMSIYEDGRTVTATALPESGMPRPDWAKMMRFPQAPAAKLYQELLSGRPKGRIRPISADDAPREFELDYFKQTAWLRRRDVSLCDLQKMVDERIKDGSGKTPYVIAKKAQKRHDRRLRWTAAISLPVAAFMLTAAYFILGLAWDARCLGRRGKVINATVTDTRIRQIRSRHSHEAREVRYRFQLDERGPVYTCRDPWRGDDAWASLKFSAYDEAKKTGLAAVKYDPTDPWRHELAEAPGIGGVTDSPWFLVLGSLPFIFVGLLALVLGFSTLMLILIG